MLVVGCAWCRLDASWKAKEKIVHTGTSATHSEKYSAAMNRTRESAREAESKRRQPKESTDRNHIYGIERRWKWNGKIENAKAEEKVQQASGGWSGALYDARITIYVVR